MCVCLTCVSICVCLAVCLSVYVCVSKRKKITEAARESGKWACLRWFPKCIGGAKNTDSRPGFFFCLSCLFGSRPSLRGHGGPDGLRRGLLRRRELHSTHHLHRRAHPGAGVLRSQCQLPNQRELLCLPRLRCVCGVCVGSESTQGIICQQVIQKILKETDNLGGGLPPNLVVPIPEHQKTAHSRVGGVVALVIALCQQCVFVCACVYVCVMRIVGAVSFLGFEAEVCENIS